MSLASPNAVIKVYYPDFSVKELLGLRFNRLTAAEESTGYRSVSYTGNMSTYVFFIVIGAVGLVLLVVLFLGVNQESKSS
jgi:hypothetical protein